MTTFLWANDRGLEDFGGDLVQPFEGWTGMTALTLQSLASAGQHGQIPIGVGAASELRRMRLGYLLRPATVSARRAALDSLLAHLAGELWVRTYDDPTRFTRCVCLEAALGATPIPFVIPDTPVILNLVAFDPLYYNVQTEPVVIPVGKSALLPCGTAGGAGVWLLRNITTSTILSILTKRGTTRSQTTLTGSTTTGHLRLDGVLKTIQLVSNTGSELDAYAWKTVTDPFPSWEASDVPSAALSSSAKGLLLARRAYLS